MPDLLILIATFLIGVAASFLGVVAGAGGVLSLPFLIFMGLPPQVAIATNKFGGMGISIGASYKLLWKSKKILWKYVTGFCLLSMTGSYLGAQIVMAMDPALITDLVGVSTLIMLPLVLFSKKEKGIKPTETSRPMKVMGHIAFFCISLFAGSFGTGSGIFMTYAMITFFGFTMLQIMATVTPPYFLLSLTNTIVFAFHGLIDYHLGIALFLGMITGGHLGAHTALKKGDAWIKTMFTIMVAVAGIKLLFS